MNRLVPQVFAAMLLLASCENQKQIAENEVTAPIVRTLDEQIRTNRGDLGIGLDVLSAYGFFKAPLNALEPTEGVIPYDLNTPLFSDYAFKARFMKLPEGSAARFDQDEVIAFPIGTVLIKNFYYPMDFGEPNGKRKILETRLLIKESEEWKPLSYIWNEEQSEAYLEVTGGIVDISWTDQDGILQSTGYSIPNLNQCKNCHAKNQKVHPIGPSIRQLNGEYEYEHGRQNQIDYLVQLGVLLDVPERNELPRLAHWNDPKSGTLDDRARAYLDINCGSCHRPEGTGNTSGLFLTGSQQNDRNFGIRKPPVAAGRGSGGLQFDILPGSPEKSILLYRMKSTDPGVMMPEIGRGMVHQEGVELIAAWIDQLGS